MVRRIVTVFSNREYEAIEAFSVKKGLSIYALAKKAVRAFVGLPEPPEEKKRSSRKGK